MKLFTCVWDSRSISQDWKDVLLIPAPKKICHFVTVGMASTFYKWLVRCLQRLFKGECRQFVVVDTQCGLWL